MTKQLLAAAIAIVVSMVCTVTVSANEISDTIKVTQLEEVEVEGANHWTEPSKSVYIPTKQEKKASLDATDLLTRMAIPEIRVDRGNVTDVLGEAVSIFIDGRKAQSQELRGMRMSDVQRVEYLINPSDPRFQGARTAINFIMKQYSYGGYTKLYETLNWDMASVPPREDLFVFSKLVVKKSTWNFWGEFFTAPDSRRGSNSIETYNLPDGMITRKVEFNKFKSNEINPIGGVEYVYSKDKIDISQQFNYGYIHSSHNTISGIVEYEPDILQPSLYKLIAPGHRSGITYNANYFFNVGKGWSSTTTTSFNYLHSDQTNIAQTTGFDTIDNSNKSDYYSLAVQHSWRKRFDSHHNLFFKATGSFTWSNYNYLGFDAMTEKQYSHNAGFRVTYQFQNSKIWLNVNAYGEILWYKVNNDFHRAFNPSLNVFMRYSINRKNNIQLSAESYYTAPSVNNLTTHITQSNEFYYVVGNPDMKVRKSYRFNISYSWMPSNPFMATAYVNYTPCFDQTLLTYLPYPGKNALIQSYVNGDSYHPVELGINFNYKLLKNSLVLSGFGAINYFKVNGGKHLNGYSYLEAWYPKFQLNANYYIKNFNFGVSYTYPFKYLRDYGFKVNRISFFSLVAGWGNGKWNIQATLSNPWQGSYKLEDYFVKSPYYSFHSTPLGWNGHKGLSIQGVYTFGYGKHVNQSNERTPQNR